MNTTPSMAQIVNTVAELYGLPPEQVRAHRQDRPYVDARHVAMWLCRYYGYSLPQIARLGFRGRHHTTILHGSTKIERARHSNAKLAEFLTSAVERIGGQPRRVFTTEIYVPDIPAPLAP